MNDFQSRGPARRLAKQTVSAVERPKPLHATVIERLRDMIVEGELATGERLHDANLAATLNVSRTPIREAIKLLATEGLVDLLPGRGARVSDLSIDDIMELLDAASYCPQDYSMPPKRLGWLAITLIRSPLLPPLVT